MSLDRRNVLARAGLGLAASMGLAVPTKAEPLSPSGTTTAGTKTAAPSDLGIVLKPGQDNAVVLQAAIDQAASRGIGLRLPPGQYAVGRTLILRPGTAVCGALGQTRLTFGAGAGLQAQGATGLRLEDLTLDGANHPPGAGLDSIVTLIDCARVHLERLVFHNGAGNGLTLRGCSGSVRSCRVDTIRRAGIFLIDGPGAEIAHNHVHDCGDNGILVWTTKPAELGATILANRIERIAAKSGGSGQYGNGINVYRAGGVLVANNRITDCAYTAIRGNAASNIQMIANSCARLGEVALYAEFGFEGALIANNSVDGAAAGISVTNFNEGGRLAVVQGNLIRNLTRREHEPDDKRGEGISVEADSVVTGNVIEGAPTAGIFIGWGRYMREVSATGNLIRKSRIGIAVQVGAVQAGGEAAEGSVLIAQNMISGARDGAIRTLRLHEAFGADLARTPASPFAHITCLGNVAT